MATKTDLTKARVGAARNCARKILKELKILQPPVVINTIVKHLQNQHDISVEPRSFGSKTSGAQISINNSCVIGYNKNQHPHHQRFTVAHELGHFLMGHNEDKATYDFNSKDPQEMEANQFAAELLMPLAILKNDIESGIKIVVELATRYNVSEEAMWWKITDNNLFKNL